MESQTPTVDRYFAKLEKVRPLGKMEEFSSARHHLDLFKNVGITGTFTFTQTSSPFSLKDLVFYALTNVLHKHANLSTIVVDEDSDNPCFARLPNVDLEKAVEFLERKILMNEDAVVDKELDDLLEIENNTSFKSQYGLLPLWRLVILSHPSVSSVFTASFFFHHALGDGTSALLFLSDFQEGLNSFNPGVKTSVLFNPEKKSMLPSLEALLPHPYIPSTSGHPENVVWSGECNRAPTAACGKFHTLTLTRERSMGLSEACKVHKTTITALLTVLVANSLFQILPERHTQLNCTIPVNIRNLLSLDKKTAFGVYIDAFNLHLTRHEQENFNWQQVIQVKTKILEYFTEARKGKINVAGFKNIPSMRKFSRKGLKVKEMRVLMFRIWGL
ncbi:hypothetical protein HYFRA_00000325 [Hymenoscyphus fraxineus]|uniref:Uncharacterized protein n=1 Tax=Hymenoscyphus fraxineus TaxID=746836 RepID=A0A9N9PXT5_9HELO|nr:hypothetical protein HYFRA_00000325 [Hymenoscyphus fraxineus]